MDPPPPLTSPPSLAPSFSPAVKSVFISAPVTLPRPAMTERRVGEGEGLDHICAALVTALTLQRSLHESTAFPLGSRRLLPPLSSPRLSGFLLHCVRSGTRSRARGPGTGSSGVHLCCPIPAGSPSPLSPTPRLGADVVGPWC